MATAGHYPARDEVITRSWVTPQIWPSGDCLLAKEDFAHALIHGFEDMVECLPVRLEGAPWTLLHYVGRTAVFDEKRSDWDPPPMPHPFQRYCMIRRVVLQDSPRLYSAFFTVPGTGEHYLFCGAGFRERVMQLGLVGLQFREVGYFHREGDPEPPPPRPAPASRQAIDLPPPRWTCGVPAAALLKSIADAEADLRRELNVAVDAPDDAVLAAVTQHLVALRPRYAKLPAPEQQRQLPGIAALYGGLYVQQLRWQWRELTDGDERRLAVTSPGDSYFIAPSVLAHLLLTHKQREITLALQFNMARAGFLPPSAPGALVELR